MSHLSSSLKLIIALSFGLLFVGFYTCNNQSNERKKTTIKNEYSSISIVNETYKIDTNIAITNWKKEKLVARLETENLTEKKSISEIPDFIKTFLDGISTNKTFDIANPDEEWQEGGWVNGFAKEQKIIVHAVSSVAKPFPTKQLIYCGIGKNTALISYYIGGIKKTQNSMIIKFQGKKIVDLWFDRYYSQFGYSLGGTTDFVTSKADIIKYIKDSNSGGC